MTDAERVWALCAEALQGMVSEAAWRIWFTQIQPSWADEYRLVLSVPNAVVMERLLGNHHQLITDAVSELAGHAVAVDFVVRTPTGAVNDGDEGRVDEQEDDADPVLAVRADLNGAGGGDVPDPTGPGADPAPSDIGGRERNALQPNFNFDAFVTADSNRFARAAAGVVAETPGLAYNPLVIYGDSGLGKTHLLHAIGNYVRQHFPNYTVRYTPTEACMNEFVEALRSKTTLAFKRRYRECDVLLMDDFQFIMQSERLGEEFFYTFNELQEASKQIVIVSDRSPTDMISLHGRFRSRLLAGLVTDVKAPDLETRIAILRKKAEKQASVVPDDVLVLIANLIRDNIRELEGALTKVVAYARLHDYPLTFELAEKVLAEAVSNHQRPVTLDLVIQLASELSGFSVDDLKGPNRSRPLVQARQIAMYVLRQLTDYSYPAIANSFGGRDHTTVIHAVKKIESLMPARAKVYQDVEQLTRRVMTGE
ncbi:MAG TPA: chromosomal replication initiator protein DnaA [Acidimicrobiales bacterium]|nr:chromosomal replication initiator protein DnaA [Acidimicrobiales bacterium]